MRKLPRFALGAFTVVLLAFIPAGVPVGVFVAPAEAAGGISDPCAQTHGAKSASLAIEVHQSGTDCFIAFKKTDGIRGTTATVEWNIPNGVTRADVLVVGGGGGGGAHVGAGGGAGGFSQKPQEPLSGTKVQVTVGDGGKGAATDFGVAGGGGGEVNRRNNETTVISQPGQPSKFGTVEAGGGGRGAFWWNNHAGFLGNGVAGSGASGGGAVDQLGELTPGGVATPGDTGNPGGAAGGVVAGTNFAQSAKGYITGGGGGAGLAGNPADHTTGKSGAGGTGASVSWISPPVATDFSIGEVSGALVYFAGGGGGGYHGLVLESQGVVGGAGGLGGGGAGKGPVTGLTTGIVVGESGKAHSGGGGGGAGAQSQDVNTKSTGGDGGSGVVVVRYSLVPDAPTSLTPSAGDGQVALTWFAPAYTGGLSINDYVIEYKAQGGSWKTFADGTSATASAVVTGLTNGTSYTFRVSAANSAATGAASSESSAVTPRGTQVITWAPTNTFVNRGASASMEVTLDSAATALGGAAVTYAVASQTGATCSLPSSSSLTVTVGGSGTCVVTATSAEGEYASATATITLTVFSGAGTGACAQNVTGTATVLTYELGADCLVVFTSASSATWRKPNLVEAIHLLAIGGGGGGGPYGGGGAGELFESSSFSVPDASYSVSVGAGGAGYQAAESSAAGFNGETSVFGSKSVAGGGAGGGMRSTANREAILAQSGGSGGGGGTSDIGTSFLGGTSAKLGGGHGNSGGAGARNYLGQYAAGGGGGAGGAGSAGVSTNTTAVGGAGGTGRAVSILSAAEHSTVQRGVLFEGSVYFAGGGGGGGNGAGGAAGVGGRGGGGNGGASRTAGLANTGGGGGGTHSIGNGVFGAAGGSGVVMLRYTRAVQASAVTVAIDNPNLTMGGTATLSASGGSGTGAYSYTSSSTDCTISGATLTAVAPSGTCVITAIRAGDASYQSETSTNTVTVTLARSAQASLTVTASPTTVTYGQSTTLGSSGGSGTGGVSFTLTSGNCSLSGSTLTANSGTGTCQVTATKASDDNYTAITSSAVTITLAKASQSSLSFSSADTMVFGESMTLVATGGSGSGALTYSKISGDCSVVATVVSATGTGSCVVKATRAGDNDFTAKDSTNFTITMSRANQTINFSSSVPVSAVAGTTYIPTASSTSGLSVSFSITTGNATVCSLSGGVVTFASSGECVITATQSGNTNYTAATAVTQTIVAGKINQTITFGAIATKDFDSPSFTAGASVSSARNVTYQSSTPSVCSVGASTGVISIVTTGECSVTASSAGDASYAAASDVTRTFTIRPVVPGKPSVTSVSYGDSLVTIAFSAPGFVGGASIDGYQVVATSSEGTVIKPDCGNTSPCTITGLTNGQSYTLSVAAINAAGIGPSSEASPAIVPATIPDAVSALRTTPGNAQLVVEWTEATSFGGGIFERYDVYLRVRGNDWGAPVAIGVVSTESYTFTGLVNGVAYDVKVVTISSVNGAQLSSNTATALGVPATTPGAPSSLSASALSNTTAVVSWSAPLDDGGAAITAYATSISCTFVSPTDTVCSLSGLTAGSTVSITVGATNLMGTGPGVTITVTMPGGSSGNQGGSGGNSNISNTTNTPPAVTPPNTRLGPNQQRVIVPPQTIRNPDVMTAPVLAPGRSFDPDLAQRATVGGAPATMSQRSDNGGSGVSVVVGALEFGLRLANPNGGGSVELRAQTNSPELRVPHGESATIAGTGLMPGSQLQVWLPGRGQAPLEVGRISVKPDGSFESDIAFSRNQGQSPMPIGRQVLQVAGFDAQGRQTVVDMVINIAQGAPAPELNPASNGLPRLAPGESLATSAGVLERITVQLNSELGQIVVTAGDWQFGVSIDGASGTIGDDGAGSGVISLFQNRVVQASGAGFQPDTRVDIWLFSDPTLLGSVIVSADGSFSEDIYLDGRFATLGNHTLQLQGVGDDGFVKAVNLGVVVGEPSELTSDSAAIFLWWVAAVALGAVLLSVWALIARRRRAPSH